jgi:3-hydroxypropanoate dehydrogenase
MGERIDGKALDTLFREARTAQGFLDKPVAPELLKELYEVAKIGPLSANLHALKVVYVTSKEGKEKLKPTLSPNNVDKTMAAPVTAILAFDTNYWEKANVYFPMRDMREWLKKDGTAMGNLNATLGAAYFILAARALGLDAGPMGGYDKAKLDEAFFPGGTVKSLFLCNLGYIDPAKLFPRLPRPSYEETVTFA